MYLSADAAYTHNFISQHVRGAPQPETGNVVRRIGLTIRQWLRAGRVSGIAYPPLIDDDDATLASAQPLKPPHLHLDISARYLYLELENQEFNRFVSSF